MKSQKFQVGVVRALAQALEAKDPYTAGHSRRVARDAVAVAEALGLPEDVIAATQLAGNLHDVGKIGVPESTLNKPGPLLPPEWAQIQQHPTVGASILAPLDLDDRVILGVKHHHERFDGTGYPHGLRGSAIPLVARVLQVADSWDAMTSDRPHRLALSPSVASGELRKGRGTQFDPWIVDAYLGLVQSGGIRGSDATLMALTEDASALRALRLCQDGHGLRVLALDPSAVTIERVVSQAPDVLVLDTQLQSVPWQTFLGAVTTDERTSSLPVMLLAESVQEPKLTPESVPVIEKPIDRDVAIGKVKTVLRDAATRPRNNPSRPIRLVLADDHTMFREGLRQLLELEDGLEVVGEANDGVDAESVVGAVDPDVIVMDINMPYRDGIQTTRAILESNPNARVLLLTMHQQDSFMQDAVRVGAMGYLLKSASAREIVQAIRAVKAGTTVFPLLAGV